MPTFRPDLQSIPTYKPGKPIDEVARELGLDDIAKLASNECPVPPFPEVRQAIAEATTDVNRYPDNSGHLLVEMLGARFGTSADHVWLGAGSTQLLLCSALAMGGPGTSAVFADPSFVMYRIVSTIAATDVGSASSDQRWSRRFRCASS